MTGKCLWQVNVDSQNVQLFSHPKPKRKQILKKKCRKDLETSNHQVRPLGPQDSSSGKPVVIRRGKHADLRSLLCQVPSRPIVLSVQFSVSVCLFWFHLRQIGGRQIKINKQKLKTGQKVDWKVTENFTFSVHFPCIFRLLYVKCSHSISEGTWVGWGTV